mmetsp:Transcript_9341/g.32461  ORF Transcript_9341/g.32461 Transcript_9341/m.32461 type:complete len:234 (+) Transcript_9341:775-1476(+)
MSLHSSSFAFISSVVLPCSTFSTFSCSRRVFTSELTSRSRAVVSRTVCSCDALSSTSSVSAPYVCVSSSDRMHCCRSAWKAARSACTLVRLSAMLGLSLRLRHSCAVVSRSSSATSWTLRWFSWNFCLLGMLRRTLRSVMSCSKRSSSARWLEMTRLISSPMLWLSSTAWAEASTVSMLSRPSFSDVSHSTDRTVAVSSIDNVPGLDSSAPPPPIAGERHECAARLPPSRGEY